MPTINAYLAFDGNCAEAMRYYERVLDGKLVALIKNGESPDAADIPAEAHDRVMHAYLTFDGGSLMAGDAFPGSGHHGMRGFSLALQYDDTAKAKDVFDTLADGGSVLMPWNATFWAEGFGMCTDKYGTPWMVNGKSLM